MTIAVITGGRDRTPTLAELEVFVRESRARGSTVLRHGACPARKNKRGELVGSTDTYVAAFVKARGLAEVEVWPAEDFGDWPACGPKRNRGMLDGRRPDMLVTSPRADWLCAFAGGRGTNGCRRAAKDRGIEIVDVAPAIEPRPWNRHHGQPPGPSIYVGEVSPLGNPWRDWRAELRYGETRADAAVRVLAKYKSWLWQRINGGPDHDPAVVAALEQLTPDHYAVCSCWPAHCHAEVVIRAWRWLQRRRQGERSDY